MAYRNPFDRLINEFFRTGQIVETGIQRRGEEQRADRLTEEQRAEEQRRIEQARGFQVEDREITHERDLEAEARTIRDAKLNELQELLQYAEPGSALWFRTQRAIKAVSQPLEGTGVEQRQAAADPTFTDRRPGEVVPGAMVEAGTGLPTRKPDVMTEENVNTLLAELRSRRRAAGITDVSNEALFNTAMEFVSNPETDETVRIAYANDIFGNDAMPEDWKDAILDAANIRDPDVRARIKDEGQMRRNDLKIQGQQIQMGGIQINRALFELGEDRRLADINYRTAQVNLATAIQDREITARVAFRDYGYVPADEDAAQELADQLNTSVEAIREEGERRWDQIRRSDDRAERIENLVEKQAREDLNLAKVQRQIEDYRYERMTGIGMLEDMQNLSANLYAAAANGDASSIEAVRALVEQDPTSDLAEATAGIDFDELIRIADEEREAIEDVRTYEKEQRQLDLQALRTDVAGGRINLQISRQGFFSTFGQRFLSGDFEEMAGDVAAFVETMSPSEIRAIVGEMESPAAEKEAIIEKLIAEASYQRWQEDQSDLSASFDMHMRNLPDVETGGEDAAAAWRATFIGIGKELGMDQSVLDSTADSLLAGAEIDWATARAKLDKLRAEAEALRREPLPEGQDMNQWYDNHLNRLEAEAGTLRDMLNSQHCSISGIVRETPGTTGRQYNPDNQAECEGVYDELQAVNGRIQSLGVAYETGDPAAMRDVLFGGGRATTSPAPPYEPPEEGSALDTPAATAFAQTIYDTMADDLPEGQAPDPVDYQQAVRAAAQERGYTMPEGFFDEREEVLPPTGERREFGTSSEVASASADAGIPPQLYGDNDFLELVVNEQFDLAEAATVPRYADMIYRLTEEKDWNATQLQLWLAELAESEAE